MSGTLDEMFSGKWKHCILKLPSICSQANLKSDQGLWIKGTFYHLVMETFKIFSLVPLSSWLGKKCIFQHHCYLTLHSFRGILCASGHAFAALLNSKSVRKATPLKCSSQKARVRAVFSATLPMLWPSRYTMRVRARALLPGKRALGDDEQSWTTPLAAAMQGARKHARCRLESPHTNS